MTGQSNRAVGLPRGPLPDLARFAMATLLAMAMGLVCGCPDDDAGDDDDSVVDDDDSGDDDVQDDDTGSADDDDDDDDDDSSEAGDDDDSAEPNVLELEDLGAVWDCEQGGQTPDDCVGDYLAFVDHPDVLPHAIPMTPEEFDYLADNLQELEYYSQWPSADPSQDVIDAMGVDFLLDGINERLLTVTLIAEEERTGEHGEPYLARQYLFEDAYVGVFRVASRVPLPEPTEADPAPAILVFHGHGMDSGIADVWFYPQLAIDGYAVFAPDLRVNNGGASEDLVTRTLAQSGFCFMGIRSYEGFLVQKFIDHLPGIDAGRVGVIGQSGGSVTLNATSRARQYGALVSDLQSSYFYYSEHGGDRHYLDETCFGLYELNELINDFSTSWTPTLEVPYLYGYHGQEDVYVPMIFDHFADHLGPLAAATGPRRGRR